MLLGPTPSPRVRQVLSSLACSSAPGSARTPPPYILGLGQKVPKDYCPDNWQGTVLAPPFGSTDPERLPSLPPVGERSMVEQLRRRASMDKATAPGRSGNGQVVLL